MSSKDGIVDFPMEVNQSKRETGRILIVAYKIEAGLGSEDASGYQALTRIVGAGCEVTLVSRKNNIEKLKADKNFAGINLIGVDVPKILSFYKKKSRGVILYYYLWQIFVARQVRKLQKNERFDIVHQFNFHADWAPHFLTNEHGKLIWGPIMHHSKVPNSVLYPLGFSNVLRDTLVSIVKRFFWTLDPFLKNAIKRSDLILYANSHLASPFSKSRSKIRQVFMPGSDDNLRSEPAIDEKFVVLFVGRFVALKGTNLVVDAFCNLLKRTNQNIELVLIGSGELSEYLRWQVKDRGMEDCVKIVPWVERRELQEFYKNASVFLYPSFEAQGLVVSEALSASLPVICIDNTGPADLVGEAGICLDYNGYDQFCGDAGDALLGICNEYFEDHEAYRNRAEHSRLRFDTSLHSNVVVSEILKIYSEFLS